MAEPQSHVEQVVADIWRELLNVPDVAPGDNFLDLGGNSLRAGEMSQRIHRALGVEVPLDVVLSEESFASLTVAVGQLLAGAQVE